MISVKRKVKQLARSLGYDIVKLRNVHLVEPEKWPPGHFYSVIPDLLEVLERASTIFSKTARVHEIDMNMERQILILKDFFGMREETPFYSREKRIRFDIENGFFSYSDAPILHYMMRRLRPKRIIEIGSGYSSACMLDTSEIYLDNAVDFTFIEPHSDRLRQCLLERDLERIQILEQPVQEVDLEIFATLQSGDLLFIDSSHVIKVGSDLQTVFFEVLPMLKPGVCIHFHDVLYPFRYSEERVMQDGTFWNEAYLLRAFLMYNRAFEVTFSLNYLINVCLSELGDLLDFLPLAVCRDLSEAGGSLYLTKTQ